MGEFELEFAQDFPLSEPSQDFNTRDELKLVQCKWAKLGQPLLARAWLVYSPTPEDNPNAKGYSSSLKGPPIIMVIA